MSGDLRFKAIVALTYLWATVMGYVNIVFKNLLRFVLQNFSEPLTPVVGTREHPFKILMAGMEGNKIITNKVKLYLKNKWEKDFCDGKGGANLHELGNILGASFLWISYVLSDEEILELGQSINKKTNKIYSISVNLKTNIIKKFERELGAKQSNPMGNEEILFHQTPLPHN